MMTGQLNQLAAQEHVNDLHRAAAARKRARSGRPAVAQADVSGSGLRWWQLRRRLQVA